GVVPIHPLDARGKTPLNLVNGVFPVNGGMVNGRVQPATGAEWKVVKSGPRDGLALTSNIVRAGAPVRTSRLLVTGANGSRTVTLSRESSIAYDAKSHRFVNGNAAGASAAPGNAGTETRDGKAVVSGNRATSERVSGGAVRATTGVGGASGSARGST